MQYYKIPLEKSWQIVDIRKAILSQLNVRTLYCESRTDGINSWFQSTSLEEAEIAKKILGKDWEIKEYEPAQQGQPDKKSFTWGT